MSSQVQTEGKRTRSNIQVFDKWITDNSLSDIKQAFIDKEMFNLTTLTMNNPNFASLMTDVRVLQKPHLTATIITSIQALLPLQTRQLQPSPPIQPSALVILSQREKETMRRIQRYINDMDELIDEYKTMNHHYENKKSENNQVINQYQSSCNTQLDKIENKVITNLKE